MCGARSTGMSLTTFRSATSHYRESVGSVKPHEHVTPIRGNRELIRSPPDLDSLLAQHSLPGRWPRACHRLRSRHNGPSVRGNGYSMRLRARLNIRNQLTPFRIDHRNPIAAEICYERTNSPRRISRGFNLLGATRRYCRQEYE